MGSRLPTQHWSPKSVTPAVTPLLSSILGLALGSPIFPSGCEGKLGVALESLQGRSSRIPPQLVKNHVAPPSLQDEALGRYSVSLSGKESAQGCLPKRHMRGSLSSP